MQCKDRQIYPTLKDLGRLLQRHSGQRVFSLMCGWTGAVRGNLSDTRFVLIALPGWAQTLGEIEAEGVPLSEQL